MAFIRVARLAPLALLLAALAVLVSRDDDGGVRVAARDVLEPPTTLPVELTTTTTAFPTPTTVLTPTTVPVPRPTTTSTSPEEWSEMGASSTVEKDGTRLTWSIFPRDVYEAEHLDTTAEIFGPRVVTRVRVDFGDGSTWEPHWSYYNCDPRKNRNPRPDPIYYQTPRHHYASPGAYGVTVEVTAATCDGPVPRDSITVAATLTVRVLAERCRPAAIREGCPRP